MLSPDPASKRPQRAVHPNAVLAICCMSLLVVGMDVTIVNVALPAMQRDLHASIAGLQWIVDAYTLVVASFLMLSGSLSDRFGRRRTFQFGLILFTAGSLCCSLSHSIGQLVAFRAVQGLGASMLNPVALSIIANVFPEARDRARAVGVWGAVAGVSLALGPILGGALTQSIGWRSVFWINLPIGIAALALTAMFVPESKAATARPLDPAGQVLLFLSLGALVYSVIEGPRVGWGTPWILALLAATLVLGAGFIVHEARSRQPILHLRFFRSVDFSSATLLAAVAFACFGGFLFLNALYLQQSRGLSALQTGLCTLPLAVAMMICAPVSGRLVGTYGSRPPLLAAGVALTLSALILSMLTVTTPLSLLLVAYALFGVGLGMVNPAISNSAVAGMPLSQAGVAAAVASTSRQVGASIGVALAGTVFQTRQTGGGFAQATHPAWDAMVACGLLIALMGWMMGTAWARNSARQGVLLEGG